MSYLENPKTIVVKNRFYPKGLREIDIWNYYQKVRSRILKEVAGRDLMFFIAVDINKTIIKRKGTTTRFIQLTNSNYDNVITGRTLSIHNTMKKTEDFGIVDVDVGDDGFQWAKATTADVYDQVIKIPIVREAEIRYTGKTGFHIICHFNKRMNIDTIRFLLRKFLQESNLSKRYTISGKRRPGVPNLDLGRNVFRSGFVSLYSLSTIGLQCMEVPIRRIMSFQQNQARI